MVRFMPGDVRIYHKDTFSGVILDELGIKRPKGQDKTTSQKKVFQKNVLMRWTEITSSTLLSKKMIRKFQH